ncbi:hypothetical protein [Mucilaginibacter polytrichastri]|uniref:LTXXQ motif protein n=1 Tax=Mucilaginibacter polytrichastri TaxID=1302689 RepID=A0A1Q6A0P7_9SPHI|nr:hypothetical protein [Mucilaginibacter polytrichastri]OKS87587.1 hypothetical protein RG47T_3048 [Mucilaginibacter polytrichastri]SFS92512.1 hypothetical protein SAMN04487890_106179 [Mucilaginibacter polytrichastri]
MKRLILILFLATGLSTLTYAKGDKTPEQKATQKTETLKKKLNLTADQTAKVKAIMLTQATAADKLKKAKPKDEKQQKEAIAKQTDAKLNAVFTASQKTGYEALKAEKKEKKAEKKAAKAKKA